MMEQLEDMCTLNKMYSSGLIRNIYDRPTVCLIHFRAGEMELNVTRVGFSLISSMMGPALGILQSCPESQLLL
jgi:hypothetical protein